MYPGLFHAVRFDGSELEADPDFDSVLVEVGIDGAAEQVLVAEVRVAVFEAAEHVVGEGLIDARAGGPAVEGLGVLGHAGIDEATGYSPAGGAVDQRAVNGIADTAAERSGPVRACLDAGRIGIVIPIVIDIAFKADDEVVVHLPVPAGKSAEDAAIEAVGGRHAARSEVSVGPASAASDTQITAGPSEDGNLNGFCGCYGCFFHEIGRKRSARCQRQR